MHKFNPEHMKRLISPRRMREMKPRRFLMEAGLQRGETLVDVGSGPGFFTLPAARIVGPGGRVYALDTEPLMLEELKKRRPPENVTCMVSGENSLPLPDETADFVLLARVLHEVEDREAFTGELMRIMKRGARLLVLDWKKRHEDEGPPYEERLTPEEVRNTLEQAGFISIRDRSINASHYEVRAEKK